MPRISASRKRWRYPEDCVPPGHWEAGIVGIVERITERPGTPTDYDVRISYRTDIANDAIPNLLNVLFGNISIRRGIKIIDVQLTDQQLTALAARALELPASARPWASKPGHLPPPRSNPWDCPAAELASFAVAMREAGLISSRMTTA